MKGVRRFGIKGKLAPRYISLYPITEKYGPLSYQLESPSKLSWVHNVFHVSHSKDVWSLRRMWQLKIRFLWSQTWHTRPTPSRYWNNKIEPLEWRPPYFIRFNGMVVQKMKPRGNMKISYEPTFCSFSHQRNFEHCPALFLYLNLEGKVKKSQILKFQTLYHELICHPSAIRLPHTGTVHGKRICGVRGLAQKAYVSCVSDFPCRVYIDLNRHDSRIWVTTCL
jgi:hypothetical protein